MSKIIYQDGTKKRILSIKPGATTVLILQTVEVISGVDDRNYAFFQCCNTISDVQFEEGSKLTTIEPYAFYNCKKIKNLDLRKCTKLEKIMDHAFNKTDLGTIQLPSEALTFLGRGAFANSGLNSIFIPKLVSAIGYYCFNNTLTSIEFDGESTCKTFEGYAFRHCKFQVFKIPKNLETINMGCFEDCSNLQEIIVQPGNTKFSAASGILYNFGKTTVIICPCLISGQITIEPTVTLIGDACFINTHLTTVVLPQVLEKIGSYAFYKGAITSIELKENVKDLGTACFSACTKLTDVKFSTGLTYISNHAFAGSGITNIVIPEKVTTILTMAFSNCINLDSITLPSTLTTIEGGIFHGCKSTLKIKFNDQSDFFIDDKQLIIMNKGKTSVKQYLGTAIDATVSIEASVTEILKSAFLGANIGTVLFKSTNTLTLIDETAFAHCPHLKRIDIPESVQTIKYQVFLLCTKLENIVIPQSLKTIEYGVFQSSSVTSLDFSQTQVTAFPNDVFMACHKLSEIKLPPLLETIGENCFKECELLKTLTIPESFTSFAKNCFACSGVEEISILSKKVKEICPYAFYDAKSLAVINIPESVEKIGYMAFWKTNITEVIIPSACQSIDSFCFSNCVNLDTFNVSQGSKLKTLGFSVWEASISLREINCKNENFIVENGALFNFARSTLIVFPPKSPIRFFPFPESVRTVSSSCFYGCNNLIYIMIPDNSIETIEDRAFKNCGNIEIINVPTSVKSIGMDVFVGCDKLICGIKVDLPETKSLLIENGKMKSSAFEPCANSVVCADKKTCANLFSVRFPLGVLLYNCLF